MFGDVAIRVGDRFRVFFLPAAGFLLPHRLLDTFSASRERLWPNALASSIRPEETERLALERLTGLASFMRMKYAHEIDRSNHEK